MIDDSPTKPFYEVPDDPRLRIASLLGMYCFKEDALNRSKDMEALRLANIIYDKLLLRGKRVSISDLRYLARKHKIALFDTQQSIKNRDGIMLVNEFRNANYKPNKLKYILISMTIAAALGAAVYGGIKIYKHADMSFVPKIGGKISEDVKGISKDAVKHIQKRVKTIKKVFKQFY